MVWSGDLAYAVGLLTTDGSLSIDGRHINLTSKDIDQIQTFARILGLKNKIGLKSSTYNPKGVYYQIQFGNVEMYRFLLSIGLTPNKTKTLGSLKIPDKYFADFLRGHLDGDGSTYSYWDKRWKSSFMLYTEFISASEDHLVWIQETIKRLYGISGKITNRRIYHLRYAKKSSCEIIKVMYYKADISCLKRKRSKITAALDIIAKQAGVLEW
ncbi:MAG: hypothetical protein NUV73_00340 [Candidatus Daviesbacteria bacterium]|nr:hypothetical protein [Candidatus Daviesbacteria bacterium]